MDTLVLGVAAVLVGALLCFRGYVTMRLIISLFGAFVGFLLGAGLASGVTDSGTSQVVLSLLAGLVGAVLFGLLAYFSYQLAVIIGMAGIGFTVGTAAMAAAGVTSEPLVVGVGVAAAVVLAVLAIATNLPAVLLVVLTALAGASIAASGLLLLTGAVGAAGPLDLDVVSRAVSGSWLWTVAVLALALLGAFAQFRALRGRRPVRQQWSRSEPAPAPAR